MPDEVIIDLAPTFGSSARRTEQRLEVQKAPNMLKAEVVVHSAYCVVMELILMIVTFELSAKNM